MTITNARLRKLMFLGLLTVLLVSVAMLRIPVRAQDLPADAQLPASTGAGAPAPPPPEPIAAPPQEPEKPYLNVVGMVPLEGELLRERITIFFDEEIDVSQTGKTPVESPGRWQVGPNYLSLSTTHIPPDEPRIFSIRLKETLCSRSGKPINPEQCSYVFTNFAFEPDRMFLVDQTDQTTRLGVHFPYAVDVNRLKEYLSVSSKSSGTPVRCEVTSETPTVHIISMPSDTGWPVNVIFAKGLPDATGQITMLRSHTFQFPSDAHLEVESVDWGFFRSDRQEVRLTFSAPVNSETLGQYLSISMAKDHSAVPYEIAKRPNDPRHSVLLRLPVPGDIEIMVKVAAGLPGGDLAALKSPVERTLKRTPPAFRVQDHWWNHYWDRGLSLTLTLSAPVKANDLAKHLVFEPELPNMQIERGGGDYCFIYGDWSSKQNYTMKITPGLPVGEGLVLKEEITMALRTGDVPSYVGLSQEGLFYYPRRAAAPLALVSRNVDEIDLRLHRMFPSNLAVALSDLQNGEGSWSFKQNWCEQLAETKVKVSARPDRKVETPIDTESLFLTNRRGVFCLEASAEDAGTAHKIVVWTDIGLLAYWKDDQLFLFAHDIHSLTPLPFAKVTLYSSKNQVLGQTTTSTDGMAQIAHINPSLGYPRVVVVETDGDYTFLELKARSEDPVAFDGTMPPYDLDGYEAFLYADRELYRPGETVHLHWSVRTHYQDAVGAMPLLLKLTKPNGQVLLEQPTTLNDLGTGGMDLETQAAYPTGKYTAGLFIPGKNTAIGSYQFSIEEFVPNRIKVSVDVPGTILRAGRAQEVYLNAQHLFGAPAKDRKCEVAAVFQRADLKTKQWSEFHFNNDSEFIPEAVQCGEQRTDEGGGATFDFTYVPPAEVTFPLKAIIVGRVFELGGRSVTGLQERMLFPSDTCLGVAASPLPGQGGIEVFAAAIRPDESPAPLAKATITLERQVWNYYVRRYYSHHEANWSESFEPIDSEEVDLVNGRGSASFDLSSRWGYYRIRVSSPQTPQYSTLSFYSYGGKFDVVDASRPSLLKLTMDKESYEIGEVAYVKVESPFDGKGIVTVQGEDYQKMLAIDIQNGEGMARIEITSEQFPNVWLEATVIHAMKTDREQVYPFSSFAMTNLRVRDPNRQIAVDFENAPAEIRPAGTASFTVQTCDAAGNPLQSEVTLAAVDEGIHLVTNYKNPDPYAWLSRDRRPDFRRAHYYDKMAHDFDEPAPGGGLDALLGKRAVSPDENWIKPVALWSGPVITGPDGRATITFEVPEFTGQLRLVAVASAPKALGAAGVNVFVRRPFMLRTSMPRFLLPSDAVECRAVLFNQTDAPASARLSWSLSGALEGGDGVAELQVPPHGEADAIARFAAGLSIGQGRIHWTAVMLDGAGNELERLEQEAALPVRAPAAYQSQHELLVVAPGEERLLSNTHFLDDDRTELEVVAGANPMLRLMRSLRYVVRYPYGCVEQTTSRLFPLYLVHLLGTQSSLAEICLEPETEEEREAREERMANVDVYIQAGISRLFSMQTRSGGLGYWPGSDEEYRYGSVYALHFLTLVKQGRQFEVPKDNFEALQRYVRSIASDWRDPAFSWRYLRAYAIYVLALDGDLGAVQEIERFDGVSLPQSSRFLLAAALAVNTEDMARARMFLSSTPSERYDVTEPDGTLISNIRNQAIELLALRQMKGDPAEIAQRANRLIDYLDSRGHGTTQETAFIIAALASYLADAMPNPDEVAATVGGPEGEAPITGTNIYHAIHEGPGGAFRIKNEGKCNIYVSLTTRGVPASPHLETVSEGVNVTRSLYTKEGTPIDLAQASAFQQADSYVAGITITCPLERKNLVVVDLLPAGFEIENPRLEADAIPGGSFEATVTPSFLDVRDDRLVLAFNALNQGTYNFYYVVRAVTPGQYQYPPIEAECMYDASVRSASAPAAIEVR